MISAVLISFNELNKLKDCINSLQDFVDEIIVMDIGSTDGTIEWLTGIKKVQLFTHTWVPFADPIRNEAINKAKGEWIIMLDPDEQLTPSLKKHLHSFLQNSSHYVAVNIPFRNIFWGHWIAHTNFWPDKHIRFFKKGALTWQSRVHSYPLVKGDILEFPVKEEYAITHLGYDNRRQFIKKQWKYSTSEALNNLLRGEHFSLRNLLWKPIREFLARYIKHQGFKDGFDGVFLVFSLMIYQILVQLKMIAFAFSSKKREY